MVLAGYRVIDLDDEGIDQHLLGKSSNLAWHRCCKQQVLALFSGGAPGCVLMSGRKSHVKHVIRFIQDERVDSRKIHISLAEQIEQSSGAGTDNIGSPLELLDLGLLRDTAVDGHGAKLGSSRQLSELFLDLGDQFSCRADHQHPWSWLISAQEVLDAGNRKCSGFSRFPVWARPSTSRPSSAGPMAVAWIGRGALYLAISIALLRGSINSNWLKLVTGMWNLLETWEISSGLDSLRSRQPGITLTTVEGNGMWFGEILAVLWASILLIAVGGNPLSTAPQYSHSSGNCR